MRIRQQKTSMDRLADVDNDIREIMEASHRQGRVCGESCKIVCDSCGSTVCQCMCHNGCLEAPARLSSDPDKFPIEPGIVPLVYEMTRDAACTPCWSCEGHERPDGSLWKIPRVWFYCPSMVHLRLIGNGVHALYLEKKLHVAWQVVITHSDPDNIETTFSLEPVLTPDAGTRLSELQADARVIAETWSSLLKSEAQNLARSVQNGLA